MRLVTRSDFDGLACAVLLKAAGLITEYKFAHPKDLQDGTIEITSNDILANVPFVPGCGMWFDHHSSEAERLGAVAFTGMSKVAPSCARVIWEYFGGHEKFDTHLDVMLDAVDRVDSGMLTLDDVNNPQGWVLLGFIMDPRTGLGRYRDYRISNYQLMLDMIDYCAQKSAEEILAIDDVKERSSRYFEQETHFREMAKQRCTLDGNVLLFDLRDQEEIYTGNRFAIYAMYPECNVSIQIIWGLKKQNTVFTVGYSILNRTCTVDIGKLMLKYGGGGHKQVGTCQVPTEKAEEVLKELLEAVKEK
jgi:nanoRNase/pAp phosphatase (c-di-AMP/oligoRNAs hydrolase)